MIALIDHTPTGIKTLYVGCLKGCKILLRLTGLLPLLDKKARGSKRYHYFRSLLSLHQIEDMIALDVPWWTYDAANLVSNYLKQLPEPASIFEYGAGASTLWLAKRSGQIYSIEHDTRWYHRVLKCLTGKDNISLLHIPPIPVAKVPAGQPKTCSAKSPRDDFTAYVEAIHHTQKQFDLIVIDGRCREACLKAALPYLKPHGIIVFDNTDRERYQSALEALDCYQLRLKGRVPGSPFIGETSLLSKNDLANFLNF